MPSVSEYRIYVYTNHQTTSMCLCSFLRKKQKPEALLLSVIYKSAVGICS